MEFGGHRRHKLGRSSHPGGTDQRYDHLAWDTRSTWSQRPGNRRSRPAAGRTDSCNCKWEQLDDRDRKHHNNVVSDHGSPLKSCVKAIRTSIGTEPFTSVGASGWIESSCSSRAHLCSGGLCSEDGCAAAKAQPGKFLLGGDISALDAPGRTLLPRVGRSGKKYSIRLSADTRAIVQGVQSYCD